MTRTRTKLDVRTNTVKRVPVVRRHGKSLRQHFREGIEAGLRAEPEVFHNTKPRTVMSQIVRELVCAATKARCDAIKLVFALVDEAELARAQAETDDAGDDSQAILEPQSTAEPEWDWNETGWDCSPREKKVGEFDAESTGETEAHRQEWNDRSIRPAGAVQQNESRAARRAAEPAHEPVLARSPPAFPGKFDPSSSPTIRIGGKLVES